MKSKTAEATILITNKIRKLLKSMLIILDLPILTQKAFLVDLRVIFAENISQFFFFVKRVSLLGRWRVKGYLAP